ncbi:MAG: hypothetical protein HY381_00320 [Candidatus Chisholmbacteria bacterium]|nr:hypothetical protein [Candidatus Chisholmbacteria bacterium]
MFNRFLIAWGLILISLIFFVSPGLILADDLSDKQKEIEELEAKISQLQGEQKTLSSTIAYLNASISKTQAQIQKTNLELAQLESDIASLSGKIAVLDVSLEQLTTLLVNRIKAFYKHESTVNPAVLLFSAGGVGEFFNRLQYLQLIQRHDRKIIFETEQVRTNFDLQREAKEQKQAEVESLKKRLERERVTLARQQTEKQRLLLETKNSERVYQERLAAAVAELAAIQGIIAGKGTETQVKDVSEGEKIATVLTSGPNLYACSSGPHLHFELIKDSTHQNPFNFLSSKSLVWDNPDPQQNGSGSWNWPVNDPIRITQSYGQTFYSSIYAGGVHTGVDMVNSDNYEVKAVRKGTLYRGGIGCRGGTLQYVRVDHADDEYDTYYLHVNYL